ncbi:hypothetical protein HIM_07286 [Hirsutella minnesotensis 3608]|uniref:Sialidase n=1 Tax=Hirsutella minnesotensis 3608 TaxID=1043627 RepID=A0A0F7ZYY5_9HYPO|nr:hypothetical protein HIM_07286 [Hirsutella minnesotensis 3608]
MSALEAGVSFDFTSASPCTPSPPRHTDLILDNGTFFPSFDPSLLHIPRYTKSHVRSASNASSIYSVASTVESTPDSTYTRLSTPQRSPPVRHHGPLLLPKIRSQDQVIGQDYQFKSARRGSASRGRASKSPQPSPHARGTSRSTSRHARSYTSPNVLAGLDPCSYMTSFKPLPHETMSGHTLTEQPEMHNPAPLLCSPAPFTFAAQSDPPLGQPSDNSSSRSSSVCDVDASAFNYSFASFRPMPYMAGDTDLPSGPNLAAPESQTDLLPSAWVSQHPPSLEMTPVYPNPGEMAAAVETTTVLDFLTAANPAASLVRNISLPLRDPSIKHFWWDVRSIRSWTSFNTATILALPGASAFLTTEIPSSILPEPSMTSRNPETEASLHSIYASFYMPKLNAALSVSSSRSLQFSVPSKTAHGNNDLLFVANPDTESTSAASLFGGKPTARVVGLVRSFDRFNTGMRVEGNIKRVEYLRGLAALHYAMREHSCRYGFILTEIELVLVRCGTESTPFFGDLDITSVHLAVSDGADVSDSLLETPLTACLALWGLCQLAADNTPYGHSPWKAEIGAPAEGTRRKARPRDSWMPQPQLTEKREAKRSRGWVWPEDPVGRKEIGKRGVRYNSL